MTHEAVLRTMQVLEHMNYSRPADAIADLIHYCNSLEAVDQGDLDFEEELRVARLYVEDEVNIDAATANSEDQ